MSIIYFQNKSQILTQGEERSLAVIQSFEASINAGTIDVNSSEFNKELQAGLDEFKKDMPELEDFTIYSVANKTAVASSAKENVNKAADPEDIQAAKDDKTITFLQLRVEILLLTLLLRCI